MVFPRVSSIQDPGLYGPYLLYRRCLSVRQNASFICPTNSRFFSSSSNLKSAADKTKANIVRSLFRRYGLNDAHISQMAKQCPAIYRYSPHLNLLPKLKLLASAGIFGADLAKTPSIFSRNLETKLIPCYDYLMNVPISWDKFQWDSKRPDSWTPWESYAKFVSVFRQELRKHLKPAAFLTNVKTILAPNVELLRGTGVAGEYIMFMVSHHPLSVSLIRHERFKTYVERVKAMGLDPASKLFVQALIVLCKLGDQGWAQKLSLYRSFGLLDDQIESAFGRQPSFMTATNDKILRCMEILVNELSLDPAVVVRSPNILCHPLETTIVPRCRVIKLLIGKGLLKEVDDPLTFLNPSKDQFFNMFIDKYKDSMPELMDVYSGKKVI